MFLILFVNSELKKECHVVKNTLLQTAFPAILPTGNYLLFISVNGLALSFLGEEY